MKALITLSSLALVTCLTPSCADGDSSTNTSAFALTDAEAEALESCIAELEACRQSVSSGEEYREVCGELHACLPERESAGVGESDWRRYCADVAQRCVDSNLSDEECAALQERCDRGFGETSEASSSESGPSEMSMEQGMCIRACMEEGGSEEECSAQCTPA